MQFSRQVQQKLMFPNSISPQVTQTNVTLPQEFLWQNKQRMSTGGLGCEVFWGLCCTVVHLDKSIPRCFAELLCLQKGLAGQAEQSNLPAGHLPGLGNATDPGFSLQCLHHLLWGTVTNLWGKKKPTQVNTGLVYFPPRLLYLSMHQCMTLFKNLSSNTQKNHPTFIFCKYFLTTYETKATAFWEIKMRKKYMYRKWNK